MRAHFYNELKCFTSYKKVKQPCFHACNFKLSLNCTTVVDVKLNRIIYIEVEIVKRLQFTIPN